MREGGNVGGIKILDRRSEGRDQWCMNDKIQITEITIYTKQTHQQFTV
jgi:hypothetical protein